MRGPMRNRRIGRGALLELRLRERVTCAPLPPANPLIQDPAQTLQRPAMPLLPMTKR